MLDTQLNIKTGPFILECDLFKAIPWQEQEMSFNLIKNIICTNDRLLTS